VLYVTERCVFRLTAGGLELIEVAPGIDIERDILARMDFEPVIRGTPQTMEAAIFGEAPMGLRERMLEVPLASRFAYDDQQNIMFINFERLRVRTQADVDAIEREVDAHLKPIGHRVYAIVNYDHFELARKWRTPTRRWSRGWSSATTTASRATRPRASCAPSWAAR
jgi:propionate CoA-transferase